jgi:hypothetical protein
VKRLTSWSVLRLFVLSVAISGLPATGIAQTRTPVVLIPGYSADRFPNRGAKRLVSTAGGGWARWARDGSEVYYLSPIAN